MKSEYEIWSDNLLEAHWFMELDPSLSTAKIKNIGKRGSNPVAVEQLVVYDRPDIILLKDENPILVVEKTREVPTGHNVGQRVARLARAAEFSVPTLFFLPFDAMKHGKHSSICSLNVRLIRAMLRMTEIHEVPVLPVNWPMDSDGELIVDGSENNHISVLISALIGESESEKSSAMQKEVRWLKSELLRREMAYQPYSQLPKSARFESTKDFFSGLGFRSLVGVDGLESRAQSLVYRIDMSPEKCRRQDPYTGMQFIYDYGWLRKGKKPSDRESNLILHVPRVDAATWLAANPEDYETKSCNWYLVADAIVLKDAVIPITEWPLSDSN
jgi:hypothetical protein